MNKLFPVCVFFIINFQPLVSSPDPFVLILDDLSSLMDSSDKFRKLLEFFNNVTSEMVQAGIKVCWFIVCLTKVCILLDL